MQTFHTTTEGDLTGLTSTNTRVNIFASFHWLAFSKSEHLISTVYGLLQSCWRI